MAENPSHSAEAADTETPDEPELLPLDRWHRARGARMVPFAGYAMPIQYEGIMAEHLWTRESAGLFDVSHMGQLILSAENSDGDAQAVGAVAAALETLVPGDVAALGNGRMRYSLLLNEAGGILDDLMLTRRRGADGDEIYMVVNGAVKWDDIAHLREHLPDAIIMNHLEDQALLALQGPKAVAALTRLVPGVDALTFMTGASFLWDDVLLWISRSGYTGEDGVEISLPAAAAERFADALLTLPEVKPIGLGARDSLRLEAGLPLYGHDLGPETNPVSAALTFAIQKRRREAGGFPGADAILADLAKGASSTRVGLKLTGRQPAREGAAIYVSDRPDAARIGTVTSGGFAPSVGAPIAMGYIETAHATPGTQLAIDVRGKRLAAEVCALPFVPHRYHRAATSTPNLSKGAA